MEVITAKTAGFCFGVKRAVNMAYEQAGHENVYTYGPIIHNESVIDDLAQKGINVIDKLSDINTDSATVIIRAHGIEKEIYNQIDKSGYNVIDATCPFVLKIHKIVEKANKQGEHIVVVGDKNHPEVKGIESCARDNCTIIADVNEAKFFIENSPNAIKKLCIVAQTTFNFNKFQELVEIFLKNSYDRVDVLNTICNATQERQAEAAAIAATVDAMIVIGGRNSSNTQKLYDICSQQCDNTFFIQTAADMDFSVLKGMSRVGITAGASTPNNIIEEVQTKCQI